MWMAFQEKLTEALLFLRLYFVIFSNVSPMDVRYAVFFTKFCAGRAQGSACLIAPASTSRRRPSP
jgi:hypothetical protein